jgi:hypothetical protein
MAVLLCTHKSRGAHISASKGCNYRRHGRTSNTRAETTLLPLLQAPTSQQLWDMLSLQMRHLQSKQR